jgi:hypothetical protein
MSKVVKYIIYWKIIHNLGYFSPTKFGNVVVEYHLSCIMKNFMLVTPRTERYEGVQHIFK